MQPANARNTALFIAILAGFVTPFDLSAVNIALPTLAEEFSMDAIQMGWVSTAYLLASAVFLVPFGRIADIYGRKKVFAAGLAIFTLASFLMIFAPSALAVILLRVLQGFGSAMIFGTAVAILTSVTPPEHRGKALGIYTTAVYLGLSMGPFLGGILTDRFGWRSIFFVNIPIGILAVALVFLFLKGEWADCRGERFDLGGSIQYGLTLICVMYGFSLLPDREGFILLIAGAVMLVVFVAREFRISYPLWNIRLFAKNRVFLFSNLAALINYGATFAVTFFLSLYLQYIHGYSPEHAGMILVVQPVVMVLVSPAAGRLSDRIEPGKIASAGMALSALSLVLLAFTGSDTPHADHYCDPGHPRRRPRDLLVAEHQRGHGFGGAELLRRGFRHARDHAPCRADALHGHCDDGDCDLCRECADHAGSLSCVHRRHEDLDADLCRYVHCRHLLLAGPVLRAGKLPGPVINRPDRVLPVFTEPSGLLSFIIPRDQTFFECTRYDRTR